MKVFGVIPARGGSKAVPRKNLRLVAGRPLISYTIEAAKQSRLLTEFATSTDDDEIASVARSSGSAAVKRPAELATDDTPMVQVVQHALAAAEQATARFELVVVLQPTSPLRTAEDIDGALSALIKTSADSVISVYRVGDHHPARMYQLLGQRLVPYTQEPADHLRQDLVPLYHRNGAIYACRRSLVEEGTLIGRDILPYIMPRERSVNIDTELDLLLADAILSRQSELLDQPS